MPRRFLLTVALFVLLASALTACGGTEAPAEINITQQQYDAALAKWQSQGITQYALEWGQTPQSTNTETVSILYVGGLSPAAAPFAGATDPAIPTPSSTAAVDYDPIANLFNRISSELQSIAGGYNSDFKYQITFDPDLGYPAVYSESCKATAPTCTTDKLTNYRIYKLQPLKQP